MDSSVDEGLFSTQALRREIISKKSKDLERQLQLQNARSLTKAWYQTPAAGNGLGFFKSLRSGRSREMKQF